MYLLIGELGQPNNSFELFATGPIICRRDQEIFFSEAFTSHASQAVKGTNRNSQQHDCKFLSAEERALGFSTRQTIVAQL